jgi:hypothetical protein
MGIVARAAADIRQWRDSMIMIMIASDSTPPSRCDDDDYASGPATKKDLPEKMS